jgi:hypothetical protein
MRVVVEFNRLTRFTGTLFIAVGKREWFIGRVV